MCRRVDLDLKAIRRQLAGVFRDLSEIRVEEEPLFEDVAVLNPSLAFLPNEGKALVAVGLPTRVRRLRSRGGEDVLLREEYQAMRYLLFRNINEVDEKTDLWPIAFMKCDPKELYSVGIRARPITIPPRPRMSAALIKEIKEAGGIKPENVPTPLEVFRAIKSKLVKFHEFPDEQTANFVTIWIIGTHFFPLFAAYPYLHIWGIKRVGKSKLLHFTSLLAFNTAFSNNLTTATIFRLIDECMATLLMDETEDLTDPQRRLDMRSVLLAGYKRGSVTYRVEGERRKYVRDFEVYSPKALANISGVEDVLVDRAVTIVMQRSIDRAIVDSTIDDLDPEWQKIRDKLYLLALCRWKELYDISKELKNPSEKISAREYELWHSIFCIAKWLSDDLLAELIPWAEGKAEEKEIIELNDNKDLMLLHTLTRHVDKTAEYSAVQIRDWLKGEYPEDEAKGMEWLNTAWIGRALRRLGFLDSRKLSREGGRHFYTVNKDKLDSLARKARLTVPAIPDIPVPGLPHDIIRIDTTDKVGRHLSIIKVGDSRPTTGIAGISGIVPKVGLKEEKDSEQAKDASTAIKEDDSQ